MAAVVAILAVVTAILAVIVVSLLRSHADILRALHDAGIGEDGRPSGAGSAVAARPEIPDEGRALGAAALDITGQTPTGDALNVSLEAAPRTLLAFLSSGCLTCRDLWTTIDGDGVAAIEALGSRLVVVSKGPEEESPAAIRDLQPATVPTVMSSATWEHFGVPVSPYFVLVDGAAGRVVGEGAGRSWSQVQRLLGQALADAGSGPPAEGSVPRRAFLTGRDRERRADRTLAEAGILPGDPSLYPSRGDGGAEQDG
jgi:hypothetical protein